MNQEPIISVSGLRGIIGETLSPEVASRYVRAFAAEVPAGPIVISRDGRGTGRMLADAVRSTLNAVGRDVVDLDVAATPTTGVMVSQLQAAGGVQISASHNPPTYNGLKLFGPEGRVLTASAGEPILARYRDHRFAHWVGHHEIGCSRSLENSVEPHLDLVLSTVNVPGIQQCRFNVLLDSNHGAGSRLGRELLVRLGCQITLLGDTPDGKFAHEPEPTAENLRGVSGQVMEHQAAVGFCQDPDADRLALIDEAGRYVGEEFTLAIAVAHMLLQNPGPIVTNCSTSRMSQDLAEQFGVPFYRSKVGEANVTQLMIEKKAVFGGEGNGGPIDPRVVYVRDSFVGMAIVLDAMASRGRTLSQLVAELPQYAIYKAKVTLSPEDVPAGLDRLESHFRDAQADRLDGLRLDWPDRWLLVRASNTEPIVRLVAEARDATTAEATCREAAEVLSAVGL